MTDSNSNIAFLPHPPHHRFINLSGEVFSKLTALGFVGIVHSGALWLCRCECGKHATVSSVRLRFGRARSCGCDRPVPTSRTYNRHPIYGLWKSMKSRCFNPNSQAFKEYGGRGITVCDRWRYSFADFLADMGERPNPKHSVERRNNNGHYEPDNCYWATQKQQTRNTRNNVRLTYNGKTQTLVDWANELHIKPCTLANRIRTGWPVEIAFTARWHAMLRSELKKRALLD